MNKLELLKLKKTLSCIALGATLSLTSACGSKNVEPQVNTIYIYEINKDGLDINPIEVEYNNSSELSELLNEYSDTKYKIVGNNFKIENVVNEDDIVTSNVYYLLDDRYCSKPCTIINTIENYGQTVYYAIENKKIIGSSVVDLTQEFNDLVVPALRIEKNGYVSYMAPEGYVLCGKKCIKKTLIK